MDALKKELSKEEVVNGLESQINQALYDLENTFLPELGHGETKRLLLAEKRYPMIDTDFSGETNAMKQAFSACKVINDAQVALGVEVVIEQIAGGITKMSQPNEGAK
jgi:hypothetical protein